MQELLRNLCCQEHLKAFISEVLAYIQYLLMFHPVALLSKNCLVEPSEHPFPLHIKDHVFHLENASGNGRSIWACQRPCLPFGECFWKWHCSLLGSTVLSSRPLNYMVERLSLTFTFVVGYYCLHLTNKNIKAYMKKRDRERESSN